jgi:hypothetical protein
MTNLYKGAPKSVNWLVKCTLEYVRNVFITEFTKIVENEAPHVQCTTQNAVMPFYILTDRFK